MFDTVSKPHLYPRQTGTTTKLLSIIDSSWETDEEGANHLLFRERLIQSFYLQCTQSPESQKEED